MLGWVYVIFGVCVKLYGYWVKLVLKIIVILLVWKSVWYV